MGILGKLQFWKKEDENITYDAAGQKFDPLAEQQIDPVQSIQQPAQYPQYPQTSSFPGRQSSPQFAYQEPQTFQAPTEPSIHPRDVELILAKLDAIKSEMDALHQRVRKIEQGMDNQQLQKAKYW